jgi:hypothetical protein
VSEEAKETVESEARNRNLVGIKRLIQYLTAAEKALEAPSRAKLYLVHVPEEAPPTVTVCASPEQLKQLLASYKGNGWAYAFYGDCWEISIDPYYHIVTPEGIMPIEERATNNAPPGALFRAAPPERCDAAAPPAPESEVLPSPLTVVADLDEPVPLEV